jgi:hypothetical protein
MTSDPKQSHWTTDRICSEIHLAYCLKDSSLTQCRFTIFYSSRNCFSLSNSPSTKILDLNKDKKFGWIVGRCYRLFRSYELLMSDSFPKVPVSNLSFPTNSVQRKWFFESIFQILIFSPLVKLMHSIVRWDQNGRVTLI